MIFRPRQDRDSLERVSINPPTVDNVTAVTSNRRQRSLLFLLCSLILTPALLVLATDIARGDSRERLKPLDLPSGGQGAKEEEGDQSETILFYGHEFEGNAFFWCFSAYAW